MTRLRWLVLVLFLTACGGTDRTVYLDVRTPAEYAEAHIDGAINIPQENIEQRLQELDSHRGKHIVVYCRTGRRSALATAVLQAHGFTKVEDAGPMESLIARGLPLAD